MEMMAVAVEMWVMVTLLLVKVIVDDMSLDWDSRREEEDSDM